MHKKLYTLLAIISVIALFRIFPHPPNVSPVAAIALFGGAHFADKRLAFAVPFIALVLSDIVIGFHSTMVFVYAAFALTVMLGIWLNNKITFTRVTLSCVVASVVFFLMTNLGAWMLEALYPMTVNGLMQAYVAGIPFFQNSLLGNLFFVAVMFGGYALVQSRFLREGYSAH